MYTIRKATHDDLSILLGFEQNLISVERPMDPTIQEGEISYYDIGEFISSKDAEVLVAEFEGNIVASGYARIKGDRPYLKHDKQGYLGFMFVTDMHRGKGLNKLIVEELIQWCRDKAIFEIRLDVYQDNPQAIKAYEKAGFKKHMITMRLDAKDH
jgi:GNAT superfamily N-acetyltransferase